MSSKERKKGEMTVQEAGRRGGERTSETHGSEFYSEIGRKGGPKGGAERAKQHAGTPEAEGKMSLEEAGQKGGQRVRKLIAEGKEHEEK
jgi:general stress protein YciG